MILLFIYIYIHLSIQINAVLLWVACNACTLSRVLSIVQLDEVMSELPLKGLERLEWNNILRYPHK